MIKLSVVIITYNEETKEQEPGEVTNRGFGISIVSDITEIDSILKN